MYPPWRVLVLVCFFLTLGGAGAADPPEPRTDLYGDPLPDGVLARMGSVRFRHAGLSDFVVLSDGKTVLTAGSDRVLRFWDIATGRQTRAVKLQGTTGAGQVVTLSPDGKTLVAWLGASLVFWDVESGKELKTLFTPKSWVGFLYFSPDSKTLAVGRSDWRVTFLDWQTGKEREIPFPIRPGRDVEFSLDSTFHGHFSPDGKWFVASARAQEPLGVFEVATGREVHRFNCFARTSTVSPDSQRLAVSSWQNDKGERETVIRLFDLATGKEVARFPFGNEDDYFSLAFAPNGKVLACGFSDRSCLLDLTTGRVLHRLPDRQVGVAFTPDGKTLVTCAGQRLRLWDVATGKELHGQPGDFGYNPVLAVSPDGRILADGDWMNQTVGLWDTANGRLLRKLPLKGEGRYVRNVTFLHDGQTLVAAQYKGFLQFWDVVTGKEQRTVQLDDPDQPNKDSVEIYRLTVSPDGKHVSTLERISSGRESTRLAFWDTTMGKLLRQQQFRGALRNGAWSGDGRAVLLPLDAGLSYLEVETGLERFFISDPLAGAPPLVASADSRLLACLKPSRGGAKGQSAPVAVWEALTGKEVAMVAIGRVDHLAVAPDGRSLVTTDEEFLHVWDLASGRERHRWPLPMAGFNYWGKTFVLSLLLSPDGRRAFTALADGTALVWNLEPALRPAEPLVKQPGEKEFAAWWTDLASEDANRAYAASWRLAEAADEAVAFLRKHLKPAANSDAKEVRQLLASLDSETFADREKAFKRLDDLGDVVEPALRAALEGNPSAEVRRQLERLLARRKGLVRSPEDLRGLRAIQVLEWIASKQARDLLAELARGVAHVAQTREAKESLERLARRATGP